MESSTCHCVLLVLYHTTANLECKQEYPSLVRCTGSYSRLPLTLVLRYVGDRFDPVEVMNYIRLPRHPG